MWQLLSADAANKSSDKIAKEKLQAELRSSQEVMNNKVKEMERDTQKLRNVSAPSSIPSLFYPLCSLFSLAKLFY
jgi:hypothetical protein